MSAPQFWALVAVLVAASLLVLASWLGSHLRRVREAKTELDFEDGDNRDGDHW